MDNEWKTAPAASHERVILRSTMIVIPRRFTREGESHPITHDAERVWFEQVANIPFIALAVRDELAFVLENRMAWIHEFTSGTAITVDAAMSRALTTAEPTQISHWEQHARAAWREPEYAVRFEETSEQWAVTRGASREGSAMALNIGAFFDPRTYVFDIDSFRHVVRLLIIAHDALLGTDATDETRAIALAPTNISGGLFMAAGMPYDSAPARTVAAAICAIATGEALLTSAELAKYFGACAAYTADRGNFLRVVRNRRRAAYSANDEEYEKLTIAPQRLAGEACPVYLLKAARLVWDRALELGEIYGFRNANVTIIDSHGDAVHDLLGITAGCEPLQEIVLFRKNIDGSYERLLHPSVVTALTTLGITGALRDDVVRYVCGTNTLSGAPHINHGELTARGFSVGDIARIERELPRVFDLQYAFNVLTLGEELVARLGIPLVHAQDVSFNVLRAIGFTDEHIAEANRYVCGTKTVVGAPHIKPESAPIFATGHRLSAHVAMAAAVQPFISGVVRKTVHLPREATPEHIKEAWQLAWRSALKEVAVYRDGCTIEVETAIMPEPELISVLPHMPESFIPSSTPCQHESELEELRTQLQNARVQIDQLRATSGAGLQFGMRRALPSKRAGFTIEATVGNQQVYLRTGEYADGELGEIFIDMYREGAAFRSVLNCFAIAVSIGLQHGVPLEKFVDKFTYTRFEPSGFTTHPNVKMCTSIVDYIFRVLAVEYLKRDDLAQVPRDADTGGGASALQVGEQTAFLSNETPLCERCGNTTVHASGHFKCNNCGAVNA